MNFLGYDYVMQTPSGQTTDIHTYLSQKIFKNTLSTSSYTNGSDDSAYGTSSTDNIDDDQKTFEEPQQNIFHSDEIPSDSFFKENSACSEQMEDNVSIFSFEKKLEYQIPFHLPSIEDLSVNDSESLYSDFDDILSAPSYIQEINQQISSDMKHQKEPINWKSFPRVLLTSDINRMFNNEEQLFLSSNIGCHKKQNLRPSLEYKIAPIFPYCTKNYLDEQGEKDAIAVRNVVMRKFEPMMQEKIDIVQKSLNEIRNKRVSPTKKKNTTIDTKTKDKRDRENYESELNQMIENGRCNGLKDALLELSINDEDFRLTLDQQDSIIAQANKALTLCQTNRRLINSLFRIEVERVILNASVTKGILENYKTKGRHLDPEDHCGFIKISNIRMYLKKFDLPRKVKAHFVCISYCGKTIYCSNLINAKGRKLKIAKSHIFRNLPCDSEVRFQIYVIHWELNRKNSFLEFIKSWSSLLKSFLICSIPRKVERNPSNCFELCGEFLISRSKDKTKEFLLTNISKQNHLTDKLLYDIDYGLDLKYEIFSFLLVCRDANKGVWNQQWCKLDGAILKFWDVSDVQDQPRWIIDLSRSLIRRIEYTEKPILSRPISLHLRLKIEFPSGNCGHEDIYLSTSGDQQLLVNWKIKINIVLFNLKNWGYIEV